jgi:hypothetical protein
MQRMRALLVLALAPTAITSQNIGAFDEPAVADLLGEQLDHYERLDDQNLKHYGFLALRLSRAALRSAAISGN